MKRIFIFLPLLLLLPVLALGQDRFNEVGAVYGAIRSMTPEAYKEAHDKYGIAGSKLGRVISPVVLRSSMMPGSNASILQ